MNVIYDEVDQMLGTHSLSLLPFNEGVKVVYQGSVMKGWKSVIGFSGTIAQSTLAQIRAELKDPLSLVIPSLRKNGSNNRVSKVVKVPRE